LAGSLEKVRFLVVDDNAHMLEIAKTILRGFGAATVLEAATLAEATVRLKRDAVDIVVLDYQVGDEDGIEFLREIRTGAASPNPFVPVIMLTAHSDKTRVEAARDAGVSEFCTKPVTAAELMAKVAAVIDHPRVFVRTDTYVGPDRRRRADPAYPGPERRSDAAAGDAAGADR
jgi:CheY-like chemotaxis protein